MARELMGLRVRKTFERTETISEHEVSKPQFPGCGSKKVSVVPGRVCSDVKEKLRVVLPLP